jgi:aminoglycoside 2'-N-acetyltransferase I
MHDPLTIHALATNDLSTQQVAEIRTMLWAAFADYERGGMTEDDWQHALGGTHFVAYLGEEIVCHAAVVERTLRVNGRRLRTGYVEAVATAPTHQGQGHGTAVMREVNALIERDYELGALGTGSQGFYERLGWQIWRGPSSVLTDGGIVPTPDEDGYIMVLRTPVTPEIEIDEPISCESRAGDVW